MQSLTRMFVAVMLGVGASFALADDMGASDETMKDDGMMAEESMEKGMEKEDMTNDMEHGMKDDTMKGMEEDDMDSMSMDDKTMPMDDTMDNDTME
ncbi:hypothetical protein MD273_12495 [Marinobacter pelagius]|uniref:hypothetical protein n=1 Tax=Marinobacter sp. C7 TaxID=2951363 RepID=UPI001EF12BB6|nr:hypothetical protein [Marinobacter sp. C7]MCG7200544.1 hypothetical protein [Marinobacter sp. C7]